MPQKLKVESGDDVIPFLSESFCNHISLCQPISEIAEAHLLGMITKELNEKCGLDLAVEFITDWCLYEEEQSDDVTNRSVERIVYVSGIHGVRTVESINMNVLTPRICVTGDGSCQRAWSKGR